MTNELDTLLISLNELEKQIDNLTAVKEAKRKEVFEIIEKEDLGQYKNNVATISRVERKTIKFVKPQEEIISYLEENQLVKYFDVIAEEIIPEHKELSKTFDKDIKDGKFEVDGIEVETKTSPMIRFNK